MKESQVKISSGRCLLLGLALSHGYGVICLMGGANKDDHRILPSESKDITLQTITMYLPITAGAHSSPRRMYSCMLLCLTGSSQISPKSKYSVKLKEWPKHLHYQWRLNLCDVNTCMHIHKALLCTWLKLIDDNPTNANWHSLWK